MQTRAMKGFAIGVGMGLPIGVLLGRELGTVPGGIALAVLVSVVTSISVARREGPSASRFATVGSALIMCAGLVAAIVLYLVTGE